MKTLLASILLSSLVSAHAYERAEDGPMTAKQADQLRNTAVALTITDVKERLFSKKATAEYEAVLKNPFTRSIICDIQLVSTQKEEVIDTQIHPTIYAPARSGQKVKGKIEIKHGKEDDGLQWVTRNGQNVAATNCKFIDQ